MNVLKCWSHCERMWQWLAVILDKRMMWYRSIHCIYQQKLNQQPPHCTCPTQTWLNSDVFKYLLILGNGFCWKYCYCIKCLHSECGKYCVDYWPEEPAMATTYIGWIWGLSLDVSLRVNDMQIYLTVFNCSVCKSPPDVPPPLGYKYLKIQYNEHFYFHTSKLFKTWEDEELFKGIFLDYRFNDVLFQLHISRFLVCRVYVIILVIVKSSFLNDTHSMPWCDMLAQWSGLISTVWRSKRCLKLLLSCFAVSLFIITNCKLITENGIKLVL